MERKYAKTNWRGQKGCSKNIKKNVYDNNRNKMLCCSVVVSYFFWKNINVLELLLSKKTDKMTIEKDKEQALDV